MAIQDAISQVSQFKSDSLTETIASIESHLTQASIAQVLAVNQSLDIGHELLIAVAAVKLASAQINVVVHAVGILYALPHILRQDEVVEGLSLGAGRAGGDFDLVTDRRIAEFKFIHWQVGAEAVRKKTLFQDFFKLAREKTDKEKYIYLLNTEIPLRFLRGRSQVRKLLDRNKRLLDDFDARYGRHYRTVGEYFEAHEEAVQLVNLAKVVPGFDEFMEVLG